MMQIIYRKITSVKDTLKPTDVDQTSLAIGRKPHQNDEMSGYRGRGHGTLVHLKMEGENDGI